MTWEDINEAAIQDARSSDIERRYYVLRCDSQKIPKAIDILPQIGVKAFVPTEERTRRIKGSRKSLTKRHPIMSGYVVAGFVGAPNWWALFQLPWVFSVVARDSRPAVIPPASMQRLFGIHHASTASLPGAKSLKPGDTIRVRDGGFAGHEAKLLDISGADCEFVVSLFGKDFTVRRPIAEVEAA